MGHYTRIETDFVVKTESMPLVEPILRYMVDNNLDNKPPFERPEHPLFKTDRWYLMLCGSGGDVNPERTFTGVADGLHFNSLSEVKNYEDEILKFADWIRPHLLPQPHAFLESHNDDHWEKAYLVSGKVRQRFNSPYDDEGRPENRRWHEVTE